MRKCLFKRNIRVIRSQEELDAMWKENQDLPDIVGNNKYQEDCKEYFIKNNTVYYEKREFSGLFHCWGSNYEEFENGAGNYTVAIVEDLADGMVYEISVGNIQFV